MHRSATVTLLATAAVLAGMTACEQPRNNNLRIRRTADGQVMRDSNGNVMYEDDDGQHYSYYGGHYYPWFTRAAGFTTIPGSQAPAPASASAMSHQAITSKPAYASTRGGFGSGFRMFGGS